MQVASPPIVDLRSLPEGAVVLVLSALVSRRLGVSVKAAVFFRVANESQCRACGLSEGV